MTPEEVILWNRLRKDALGVRFRRQVPFGPFILDFFCVPKRLAVEVDGEYHLRPDIKQYDDERTKYLQSHGITVLRFPNERLHVSLDAVVDEIQRNVNTLPDVRHGEQPDSM